VTAYVVLLRAVNLGSQDAPGPTDVQALQASITGPELIRAVGKTAP
jgi:hypothetical protein